MEKEKGKPLAEFGTNYHEYYHKGKEEAISKLLNEASKKRKNWRKNLLINCHK